MTSILYKDIASIPFESKFSLLARKAMYDLFSSVLCPTLNDRILDLGVTSDRAFAESNFFERFYPYKQNITCAGIEDGSHLEQQYSGVRFVRIEPGQPLPFHDGEFEIVFSNAVIEHVGGTERQRAFLHEALRVARRFFITTPNRFFPIEMHTGVPLMHWMPLGWYRAVLRRTAFQFWANETILNPLTKRQFERLFPDNARVEVRYVGIGMAMLKSNLAGFGQSHYGPM